MSIIEMLFNNKTLIELNLANNNIDHDGIIVIYIYYIGNNINIKLEK